MSDLISRQDAIDALMTDASYQMVDDWGNLTQDGEVILRVINDLPSADIIRCRDCKWKYNHLCTRAVELFIDENDFCSWAERR